MSDPLAVMCERHEREHGGEEARWKVRPLLDDTCHLCVMERENATLRKRVEEEFQIAQQERRWADEILARAENAERELAETRLEWARSVDAAAATRKALQADLDARQQKWAEAVASLNVERLKNTGLQADLDAAREWIVTVGAPTSTSTRARVLALLEKRREERG